MGFVSRVLVACRPRLLYLGVVLVAQVFLEIASGMAEPRLGPPVIDRLGISIGVPARATVAEEAAEPLSTTVTVAVWVAVAVDGGLYATVSTQ
jgi:hypothetical protein